MELPEYVTAAEVRRVCRELGLRDWSVITEADVSREEAQIILGQLPTSLSGIDVEDFCKGLEVELEHGTRFSDANVTNNHPLLTGMIVLAHLKESLDYYARLEVAELEGDLLKAFVKKNHVKAASVYQRLEEARLALNERVVRQIT